MKVLKRSFLALVLTAAVSASAIAQTPPAGTQRPQTPAPPPAATQPPSTGSGQAAPKPATPPVPFPQDAKIAFIDANAIAASSTAGKEASKRLADLDAKLRGDLAEKNKGLQALQTKLNTGGAVLNDAARAQLEKEIDKAQRDIQFAQQNAQAEMTSLQNDLQLEFQKKLMPIIEDIAKEKGLHAVFSIDGSGAAYWHPGLMLTDEVVKRLDAEK
jgi:Skp family chaperone for outer membrane proteins